MKPRSSQQDKRRLPRAKSFLRAGKPGRPPWLPEWPESRTTAHSVKRDDSERLDQASVKLSWFLESKHKQLSEARDARRMVKDSEPLCPNGSPLFCTLPVTGKLAPVKAGNLNGR